MLEYSFYPPYHTLCKKEHRMLDASATDRRQVLEALCFRVVRPCVRL